MVDDRKRGMRLWIVAAIVSALLFVALVLLGIKWSAGTLSLPEQPVEDVARSRLCGSGVLPRQFEVHETRTLDDKAIVVFTAQCRPGSTFLPQAALGFMILEKTFLGWQEELVTVELLSGKRSEGEPLEYTTGVNVRQPRAWVLGHIEAPARVSSVEAVFSNGRVSTSVSGATWFVLIDQGSQGVCELRALDGQGNVTKRYDLSGDPNVQLPPNSPPSRGGWSGTLVGESLVDAETCDRITQPTEQRASSTPGMA